MSAPASMRIAITISAAILDLCLRKTRADKSRDYRDVIVSKSSVFGGQFLRISVDRRPNRRNKAPFTNSPGVAWTGP